VKAANVLWWMADNNTDNVRVTPLLHSIHRQQDAGEVGGHRVPQSVNPILSTARLSLSGRSSTAETAVVVVAMHAVAWYDEVSIVVALLTLCLARDCAKSRELTTKKTKRVI
jgi:hypothetical protein